MFRLQENVPEIYVKESRDFQLFCRLYDLINNSVSYSVKSTYNLLNPLKTLDRVLPLLSTRVGFFPKSEYNTLAFRHIISAFPYIMKYKGSKQGIEMAVNVILKAENNYEESSVNIDSTNYIIYVLTKKHIQNEALLRDVLSYILPIGYDLNIGEYIIADKDKTTTQLDLQVESKGFKKNSVEFSRVLSSEDIENLEEVTEPYINSEGSYVSTKVLNIEDLLKIEGVTK